MINQRRRNKRNLTILHSNDLHADFIPNDSQSMIVGGFPYLAGYVEQARNRHPNSTLYLLAGDLFSGNLIDYDSKGVKSVNLLNGLNPDASCIGNHSVDHTVARLAFLKHLANFPVICSNLYVKEVNRPLFPSYKTITKNGIKILLIGVVTKDIMYRAGKDRDLGELMEYREPIDEIRRVLDETRDMEFDLKIILSHLGYKEDKALANQLNKYDGIDIIIGGHSHSVPGDDIVENGIIVVQAGKNTKQIGRLEIAVDIDAHKLIESDTRWDLIPITSGRGTKPDSNLDSKVTAYHQAILDKYSDVVITLEKELKKEPIKEGNDEDRYKDNIIGYFFTDLLKSIYNKEDYPDEYLDVCLIGSGSLRTDTIGKDVTRLQIRTMYCVNEVLFRVKMTGRQLKEAMKYALSHTPLDRNQGGEYYQVDSGCCFQLKYADVVNEPANKNKLIEEMKGLENSELTIAVACGKDIIDDAIYYVGIEDFHYYNMEKFMGIDEKELECSILTVDTCLEIENYLKSHKDYTPCYKLGKRTWRYNYTNDEGVFVED